MMHSIYGQIANANMLISMMTYHLYAHIMILLLGRLLCKKTTVKKIYHMYTFIHRISMIVARIIYVQIIYILMFSHEMLSSVSAGSIALPILSSICYLEFSNFFTLVLMGYTITGKRLLYNCCINMLCMQAEISGNWIPHSLFCGSYLCDCLRDIIYMMGGSMQITKYIYAYVKPLLMSVFSIIVLCSYYSNCIYLSTDLIIPSVVLALSFIDRRK